MYQSRSLLDAVVLRPLGIEPCSPMYQSGALPLILDQFPMYQSRSLLDAVVLRRRSLWESNPGCPFTNPVAYQLSYPAARTGSILRVPVRNTTTSSKA